MHISHLLPAVALLSSASGQLHKLTKAKGKLYFGSATDNPELVDDAYVKILKDTDEFGQITPGNAMKWAYSEPTPGSFSFAGGDVIADLAKSTGQILRCHTLVWHSQVADYINNGPWTNETLIAAMQSHIKGMVEHYKGRCAHWDVVNEAFEEDGSFRKSPFYNTIGPEYIAIAFETAAKYDPDVKLYLNDYNLEYNGAKTEAARQVVKSLKARGIKIDGVGLQGHLIVGKTPDLPSLTAMVNSFADLDVEVAYTEIDVRHETLPPTTAALAQQDVDWANTVLSCINVPGCVGLTIWDFTDKYSWIPGVFTGEGDALLWDFDLKKKQVYYAVIKALGGSTATTTTTTTTTTTPAPTPTPSLIKCNRDNCLRNLVDVRYSDLVSSFCSTYTTAVVTAPSAIPTELAGCSGLPSRVSSACTCVVPTASAC